MTTEKAPAILPCRLCGYQTRSKRIPVAQAPGTRTRTDGLCHVCATGSVATKQRTTADTPAEVVRRRHEATLAALDSFMARRNARLERNRRVLA